MHFYMAGMFVGLLDSKTVVYVTHQVEFLPAADLILFSYSNLVSFQPLIYELNLDGMFPSFLFGSLTYKLLLGDERW